MMIEAKHGGFPVGDQHPTLICGVINVSPESFFKGSIANNEEQIQIKTNEMIENGAKVIDVGALSTRPISIYGGSIPTQKEELDRLNHFLPMIIEIAETYNIAVSIDTQSSSIADQAINFGCKIVNDISGLKHDPKMAELISENNVDLVIMASNKSIGDVCGISATIKALQNSLAIAKKFNISRSKISIDPGFGGWSGRSPNCDLELIQHFEKLRQFDLPIYIGVSRKSTIKHLNGGDDPKDRLIGSILLTQNLIERGAHIVRTHDVKETVLGLAVNRSLKSIN